MPIALDPDQKARIVLDADKARPEASRPAFLCRFLTRRQSRRYIERLSEVQKIEDADACHAALDALLKEHLAGWENLPPEVPFGDFDAALTPSEKWELADKVITETRLQEADRKNSGSASPSPAGGATPASVAPPASA